MNYVIKSEIGGFDYYVRIADEKGDLWRFEGLINNATAFNTYNEAYNMMDYISVDTENKLSIEKEKIK